MNQRHTLATKVHSYRAANDPQSLQRALAEVFAEVGGRTTDTADAEAFALLDPIPEGVALAAIQALAQQNQAQENRLTQLEQENADLAARLAALEALVLEMAQD